MAMNPDHTDYTSPSRLQRLESRRHREKVDETLTAALEQIEYIKRAGNPVVHQDPLEFVDKLKTLSEDVFSPIPAEFTQKKRSVAGGTNVLKIESRVKAQIGDSNNNSAARGSSQRPSTAAELIEGRLSIVNKDRPLRLSYDALRVRGKLPKNQAQSVYSGLFTHNAALHPGVEQGPVPDIYAAKPGNKRERMEARRKQIKEQAIIVDRTRKAKLLEPKKLELLGKKVSKGFLPAAAAELPQGDRRKEVEAKKAEEAKASLVKGPFKC